MWFSIVAGAIAVAFAVALFLLRVAKVNYIPAYVTVLAFVAFFIPAFTIVLLPIDLASGRADQLNEKGRANFPTSYLSSVVLLKIWRASYWLSFALTLTILPITQSFIESGYKEPSQRLVSSLRQNLRYQVIYLSIGIFGIIYILLNTNLRSFNDFKSLLIALANTWGLFLAINFLGHGLINIPRRLWRSADYRQQMHDIEVRAASVRDKLEDAIAAELDLAVQVVAWEKTTADADWLEDMAALIPEAIAKARTGMSRTTSGWFGGSRAQVMPTEIQLAALMQKIRNTKKERYQAEWLLLVTRYTYLVDCTSSSSRTGLQHRTFRSRLTPRLAYWFYSHILPWCRRLLALAAGLLSAAILWTEVLINTETPSLRFVTIPITQSNTELWSAVLMSYMACCCYSTLLRLKIFERYALLDRGHTSPSSLFFYASYCCRVTIPLSYNFINLLPADYRNCSTFSQFLAKAIDLQPLGTAFNNWLPLYILIPVLLTMGNSYDRLKSIVGIGSTWIDDDDDTENGSAAEGRDQLQTEIAQHYGELNIRSTANFHGSRFDDTNEIEDTSPFLNHSSHNHEDTGYQRREEDHWTNIHNGVNRGLSLLQTKLTSFLSRRGSPSAV